jgi:hypothetical protein
MHVRTIDGIKGSLYCSSIHSFDKYFGLAICRP